MSAWVSTPPVMARLSSTMVIAVPFLWLRDGTHPLAAGPVNPGLLHRTGRSGRCCRWVPQNLGPGRQIDSQDNPNGVSRFAGQAGTQAPTLRPDHHKTTEAGPEALKPSSLPTICGFAASGIRAALSTDQPVRDGLSTAGRSVGRSG